MSGDETLLIVTAASAGQRLDVMVAAGVPSLSRSRIQQLLAEGRITVGGEPARPSRRMRTGERVLVVVPLPAAVEDGPKAQDIPLRVLYEDREIVVVDKPAGMAVHPAPGSPDRTLVNALLYRLTDLRGIGGELRPGIVHRLDKDTTGVMVAAKSDQSLSRLQEEFKQRRVEKVYWALAHGIPKEREGSIESPLARHPVDRKRFTGRNTDSRPDARKAKTNYRVLETFASASLIEVRPETGRTHQIRVHLAEAGHPLLGDETYGGGRRDRASPEIAVRRAAKALSHHALHARRLAFVHPSTGELMVFEAELPPEWEQALERLREDAGTGPGRRA